MAQMTVPSAPREFATHYRELLGVDYQADQTEVDRRRSPDMVNMISDFGGNPVKRDGYRRVGMHYSSLVMIDGQIYGVYASDTKLEISKLSLDGYEFEVISTKVINIVVGEIKAVFAYQDDVYVVATKGIVSYDTVADSVSYVGIGSGMMSTGAIGSTAPVCTDNIPNTVISLNPDGTGGAVLDDVNIFSIYQTVSYQGNGTATAYKIPNYSKIGAWVKAEVKDANGDWQTVTATLGTASSMTGKTLDGTSTVSCSVVNPTVTFASAPSTPVVAGEDNVRITFAPFSTEQIGNVNRGYYKEKFVSLLSSDAIDFQKNRMVISDKYRVYYSDVSKPFIVSDLSWFDVDSEIVCFTRSSNYLAVITKDNGRNTIFLASEESRVVDSDTGATETYYSVKASNSGIGAIAPKCVAILSDEPLFLSKTGVFGLLTNWQSEKYAINRSSRINRRLCKEPNLENAVGIAFNDYFYLAINGRMYVLDGRHKESDRAGNKPLEAYYFEGLPAIENMYVVGDRMYFSDDDGIYTWNDDLMDIERYYDNAHLKEVVSVQYQLGLIYNEETGQYYEEPTGEWLDEKPTPDENEVVWYKPLFDDGTTEATVEEFEAGDKRLTGTPGCARWSSVYDDDGSPQRLKTLMKKGTMVTLVPHYHSGCEITLIKDGDRYEYLGSFDSDLQTFEHIDFTRFTFNANAVAFDSFTKKKIKKYKRLQILIENNKAEPFGLTQITKTYTFGNYAKR